MPPDEPAGRPPSEATSPQSPRPQLPRRARAPAPGPPAGLAPRADSEGQTLTVPRNHQPNRRIELHAVHPPPRARTDKGPKVAQFWGIMILT